MIPIGPNPEPVFSMLVFTILFIVVLYIFYTISIETV